MNFFFFFLSFLQSFKANSLPLGHCTQFLGLHTCASRIKFLKLCNCIVCVWIRWFLPALDTVILVYSNFWEDKTIFGEVRNYGLLNYLEILAVTYVYGLLNNTFPAKIWISLLYNINRIQSQQKSTHSNTNYANATARVITIFLPLHIPRCLTSPDGKIIYSLK